VILTDLLPVERVNVESCTLLASDSAIGGLIWFTLREFISVGHL